MPDDNIQLDIKEVGALITRVRQRQLLDDDFQFIGRLLLLLLNLLETVAAKKVSIHKLRKMVFGPKTEKRTPRTQPGSDKSDGDNSQRAQTEQASKSTPQIEGPKKPGHGKRPASASPGARQVRSRNTELRPGDNCPESSCKGKLYDCNETKFSIHYFSRPIVDAVCCGRETLRCSRCGDRYTAPMPADLPPQRFDATADVAISLMKYGAGMPFNRLSKLQELVGIPLSPSMLFTRCETVVNAVHPVFLYLKELAAKSPLFQLDDTIVKIQSCIKENKLLAKDERKATYTTAIRAGFLDKAIALYFSGRRYAGENLRELLKSRPDDLPPAKVMGDADKRNWPKELRLIIIKCLAHARRKFVDLVTFWSDECNQVIDAFTAVYRNDSLTEDMTPGERLAYHQQHSRPVMDSLYQWIDEKFDKHLVEPNSSLGRALTYMLKHKPDLLKFLEVEGTPLDNNACERIIKRVVLTRKNAYFYKTEYGAYVGDVLMSMIETCALNHINAREYLLAIMNNRSAARASPEEWLPWNFKERLREAA